MKPTSHSQPDGYISLKRMANKGLLGYPSIDDKLVQEMVRMLLESIWDNTFLNCSHGFRPGRSCHTALDCILKTFGGVKWFIEGDIAKFFDTIDHQVLIILLRKRVKDERFISLIWKFLKAGYLENWQFHTTYTGTPQGALCKAFHKPPYAKKRVMPSKRLESAVLGHLFLIYFA